MIISPHTNHVIKIGMVAILVLIGLGAVWYRGNQKVQPKEMLDTSVSEDAQQRDNCSENWICNSWTACNIEGSQTRDCRDINKCGTSEIKPQEKRSCQPFVFQEPQLGPFEIKIVGDEDCKLDIENALDLLKNKSLAYFNAVKKYIVQIQCVEGEISTIQYNSLLGSRVDIADSARQYSDAWLASIIVHEMIHARLYFEYLIDNKPDDGYVPKCIYLGRDVERNIVAEQVELMKVLGASKEEIRIQETIMTNPSFKHLYDILPCEGVIKD